MRGSYRHGEGTETRDAGCRDQLRARPSFRLSPFYSLASNPHAHRISAGYLFAWDAVHARRAATAPRGLTATFNVDRKIWFIRIAKLFRSAAPAGSLSGAGTPPSHAVPTQNQMSPDVFTRGAIETMRRLQALDRRHAGKGDTMRKRRRASRGIAPAGQLAAALVIGVLGGGAAVSAYEHGFFAEWARLWMAPSSMVAITPEQKGTVIASAVKPEVARDDAISAAPALVSRDRTDAGRQIASRDIQAVFALPLKRDNASAQKSRADAGARKQRTRQTSGFAPGAGAHSRNGRTANRPVERPRNFLETLAEGLKGF